MITLIVGYILLCLVVFMQWVLAVPAFIAAYVVTALLPMLLLSIAVVAVAVARRTVDKIRGGI